MSVCPVVEYKKGQRIITQGETGDAFYILVSGRCDCTVDLPSGDSKLVMQLKVRVTCWLGWDLT